jgi:hypothetical protein
MSLMRSRLNMTGVLILAALSLAASGGQADGDCFPGARESVSPAGGHRIHYRWQGDHHLLYFELKRGHAPVRLTAFEREACIHWSPAGDRFALTLHAGSNLSIVEVVRSDDVSRRVAVMEGLPDAVRALLSGSLRGYVEAVSWDPRGLIVRVHGERAGQPGGFDVRVRCAVDGSAPTCTTLGPQR